MPRAWIDPLVRSIQWNRDMRFGTWNLRSLYRAGSLTAAAREFAKYILDFVGVQEDRWDKGGMVRVGDYIFLWKRKRKITNWEEDFCTSHNSISS